MNKRKYLPTLSELVDRLSIVQLKEVFITEHKEEYAKEIAEITHDIQLLLDEQDGKVTAETIRAIVVLSQMNLHIWHNESNYRKGIKDGNNLELTHGLNGIRNRQTALQTTTRGANNRCRIRPLIPKTA